MLELALPRASMSEGLHASHFQEPMNQQSAVKDEDHALLIGRGEINMRDWHIRYYSRQNKRGSSPKCCLLLLVEFIGKRLGPASVNPDSSIKLRREYQINNRVLSGIKESPSEDRQPSDMDFLRASDPLRNDWQRYFLNDDRSHDLL